MRNFVSVLAVMLLISAPTVAAAKISSQAPLPLSLTWQGDECWKLTMNDEEGLLRLGFIQVPSGSYLLTGTLQLGDAELGVTGTGRWQEKRLVIDLSISGGVRDIVPDAGKMQLYPKGKVPAKVDAVGFAILHAELDQTTLNGVSAQYQTDVVSGDHLQGPILRLGRLMHVSAL